MEGSDRDDSLVFSDEAKARDYIRKQWHEATTATRTAMDAMRNVLPEPAVILEELDQTAFESAQHSLESALERLLRAGKGVLGEQGFREYMDEQIGRRSG